MINGGMEGYFCGFVPEKQPRGNCGGMDWPRVVSCPECGEAVPLYDLSKERQWRHLDVMQFETIRKCRVPGCHCPQHGV